MKGMKHKGKTRHYGPKGKGSNPSGKKRMGY